MFSTEYQYFYESYLKNLLMIMLAYENGINIRHALRHHPDILSKDNTYYHQSLKLFRLLSIETFDEVDYFDNEDCSLDKMFWYSQITDEEISSNDPNHLIVLSDKFLCFEEQMTVGDEQDYGAKLYPLEKGVVLVFNEDYGECDWTSVFQELIVNLKENKQINATKERTIHEMAV